MNLDQPFLDVIQGSREWFEARLGCLGSSIVSDAIAKRKRSNEELAARAHLRFELAVERLTNKPMEHYVSKWMERGTEMEPLARAAYEERTGRRTEQVGFFLHPSIKWAGASPDGLIGADGLVEFKCPKNTTHAEYLWAEGVPEEYRGQMMWQMACTGRSWCDFVSYAPDFPAPLDLFICRLLRDDAQIAEMEAEAQRFLGEVEATIIRLKGGLEGALKASLMVVGKS